LSNGHISTSGKRKKQTLNFHSIKIKTMVVRLTEEQQAEFSKHENGETPKPILAHLYNLARTAHYWTSFVPDQRAEQVVNDYSLELETDLETIKILAQQYSKDAEPEQERYKQDYESHLTSWLHSHSRTASPMIAGPAKFPTGKMQKLNRYADNHYNEFRQWRERALKAIERNFKPETTPLSELETAKKNLAEREKLQGLMKEANKIIRSKKDVTNRLVELLKVSEARAIELQQPDYCGRVGFEDFRLTNNNAEIRRLKERVKILEEKAKKAAANEIVEYEINGIKVVENSVEDCLQLFFDGIPSEEIRREIKSNGFKWSPLGGCWQRKLTGNAIFYIKHYLPKL